MNDENERSVASAGSAPDTAVLVSKRLQLTVNQIAAIRTCLHHTIRRFQDKSSTTIDHCGGVPQIECGGINVTAEIMEVLAVAEASLTDEQREMLPEVI